MARHQSLNQQLKPYGFFYLEGGITRQSVQQFIIAQKLLKEKELHFQPKCEVCYERMLSKVTSLYIEGFERFDQKGNALGYRYDFYKATYLFGSKPTRLKVYGTHLTQSELLHLVQGFSFLKEK